VDVGSRTGLADGPGVGLAPLHVHRVHPASVRGKVMDGRVCQGYSSQPRRVHCAVVRPVDRIVCTVSCNRSDSIDRVGHPIVDCVLWAHRLSKTSELLKASMMGSVAPEKRPPHSFLVDGAPALCSNWNRFERLWYALACPHTHIHTARGGVRTILNVGSRSRRRSRRQEP